MSVARRLFAIFEPPTRRRFLLVILGSVFISLAEVGAMLLVLPLMQIILGQGADSEAVAALSRLFGNPDEQILASYVAGLVLLGFVLKGVAAVGIRWWSLTFVNDAGAQTAGDLLRYYLAAPISVHSRRGTADLLRTVNEAVGQVYGAVIAGVITVITESITIVAMVSAMLLVAPVPSVAIALYFGLAGYLLQRGIRRKALGNGHRLISAIHLASRTALQALGGIKEIQLRNEQDVFVNSYLVQRQIVGEANRTATFMSELPKYAMEIVFVLGVGIMTVAAYASSDPTTALGILAVFAVAGFRLIPSTVRTIASLAIVRNGLPSLELLEADLGPARAARSGVPVASHERLPFTRELVLEDVSFRYPDAETDVLSDINLRVPKGTSLALVGHSGAGKSTLVDLILGLQKPTRGRILVDGTDVHSHRVAWQANLAMVPQDVYLLDMSLRDNVLFSPSGREADDERLQRVLEQTHLEHVVAALEEGVDTSLGERGSRLSGGQRQRVGIARALYREPSLIVLDEATSALDNETEQRVTETMSGLQGEVTLVVVAHRLSTVRRCDQVAFMENGRITGLGSFEDLRRTCPGFERLVELGALVEPAGSASR